MPITPPVASTGDIYDIRMRFALGQSGWNETYRFAAKPTASQADVLGVAVDLLQARVKFLSSSAGVRRVSLVPVAVWDAAGPEPGYVKPQDRGSVPVPRDYYGNGLADEVPYGPTNALNLRLSAGNGLYRRVLQLRGFAYTDLRFSPLGTSRALVAGAARNALDAFYGVISNRGVVPGFAFGTFVARGKSHSPDELVGRVMEAAPDITGCATVLILDRPPDGIAAGDLVHVHGVGGCGVGNLNGDATVLDVGALNSVTIDRKNCCCQTGTVKPGGTLSTVTYGYYDYQPTPDWLGAPDSASRRKTGAARSATRGRRRKRCK